MGSFKDITGKRFNKWTVIERAPNNKYGSAMWHCECECGTLRTMPTSTITQVRIKQCRECVVIDITGEKFGEWIVVERAESRNMDTYWLCICSCGIEMSVRGKDLRYGKSTKCRECAANNNRRHRPINENSISKHPLYRVHINMLDRCCNPMADSYSRYGGRGISVCDEWIVRSDFVEWCDDNGWKPGLQIDRIDNNGDYEPSNCRFVTPKQNCRNRSNNRMLTLDGSTKCAAEWAEVFGFRYGLIYERISLGWSDERILTTPTGGKR